MKKNTFLFVCLFLLSITNVLGQDLIIFEAESGTLGADWETPIPTDGMGVSYLNITTDPTNGNAPGDAARVATYSVIFPATASTTLYKVYARVWVSALPSPGNNDSMFIANDFGASTDVSDSNLWTTLNGLESGGFVTGTDIVTTGGSVGGDSWKWVQLTITQYSVPATGGTFSFQIGAREDGLLIDQLAFGDATVSYTVNNLNQVTSVPTVSTTAASSIMETSTTLAGNVSNDGGATVTARGIVYSVTSTNADPEIGGTGVTQVTSGSGTGVFSESITSLTEGTQYSFKAYAINSNGTSYGSTTTFTTKEFFRWNGTTDSNWLTGTNWSTGTVPSGTDNVIITNSGTSPIISSDRTTNNLTIDASATLTIDGSGSLLINGDLTINGTLIINSDATEIGSLIVKGTSTGNITYNKHVSYAAASAEGWHLVSSPVVGETEDDIITNGSLLTNGSSLMSLAPYDNSYTGATGWDYVASTAMGALTSAKGYSVKSTAALVPFTGTIKTDDLENHPITVGTQNSWNLIGNPYPSFFSANSSTVNTGVNFLTENIGELNPSYAAIYVWNSSTLSYEVINNSDAALYIAPGQGFFVNAKTGGGLIAIKETMLTNESVNASTRNSAIIPQITLKISDGNISKTTAIKYIEETTTGLDVGFDAGVFNGTSNSFNIYSHLVENSEEINFALQCLPTGNYENMVIPIGVNAIENQEITFTAKSLELPTGIKIFLEDRETNTFTRLDETDSYYKITPTTTLEGIGRFYMHTSRTSLSTNDVALNNIKIYKTNNSSTIRIIGLENGKTKFQLFNVLGKQIINVSFRSNGVKDISLPKIVSGIYIVQIQTEDRKLNKKIILE